MTEPLVSESSSTVCLFSQSFQVRSLTIYKWQITKLFSYFLSSISFEKGGNKFHAINGDCTSTRPTLIGLKETLCNGMARELFLRSLWDAEWMTLTHIHFIGFHWKSYTAGAYQSDDDMTSFCVIISTIFNRSSDFLVVCSK